MDILCWLALIPCGLVMTLIGVLVAIIIAGLGWDDIRNDDD